MSNGSNVASTAENPGKPGAMWVGLSAYSEGGLDGGG
jgi:hypothetical protein